MWSENGALWLDDAENQRETHNNYSEQKSNIIHIIAYALPSANQKYTQITEMKLPADENELWQSKNNFAIKKTLCRSWFCTSRHVQSNPKAVKHLRCSQTTWPQSWWTARLHWAAAWRSTVTTWRLSVTMDHLQMPAVFTVTVNTPGGHSRLANMTRGAVALFKATRVTGALRRRRRWRPNARVTRRRGRPAPKVLGATCRLARP